MKRRFQSFTTAGFLSALLLVAVSARADDFDEQIRTLKNQVARLEKEQAEFKAEQIEISREATEAAAQIPNFTYRPGSGLSIEAADKTWAFRTSLEANFRLEFESGLSEAGRETGTIFARRFRPWFYYCVNNCLYEMRVGLDLDGWGTGNGKNATNTGPGSILQRGDVWMHLEKLNAWLPSFYFGMDSEASISAYRRGSSWIGSCPDILAATLSRKIFSSGIFTAPLLSSKVESASSSKRR